MKQNKEHMAPRQMLWIVMIFCRLDLKNVIVIPLDLLGIACIYPLHSLCGNLSELHHPSSPYFWNLRITSRKHLDQNALSNAHPQLFKVKIRACKGSGRRAHLSGLPGSDSLPRAGDTFQLARENVEKQQKL